MRTWAAADQQLFARKDVYELFMRDLHQVFTDGNGATGLSHELGMYRYRGLVLADLPRDKCITIWHGLNDVIVPPAMGWKLARAPPQKRSALRSWKPFRGGQHCAGDHRADAAAASTRQRTDGQWPKFQRVDCPLMSTA